MNRTLFTRASAFASCLLLVASVQASAQQELTGSYSTRMYEDYIERGPGSFMGDYSGVPLTDEGRAKALLYTSNMPSMYERQCLAQSTGVFQYRPGGIRIWPEYQDDGSVRAWVIAGDNLRGDLRIWMDGRPHPSENSQHTEGGFITGKWEGDTLTAQVSHVKTAWIRRGVGIPGSDQSTFTFHITRHDDFLTIMSIQYDPNYLTEPYAVTRVWEFNPRAGDGDRPQCNTANEIPRLEDTGIVPHQTPGQNPEEFYMTKVLNLPHEAAMGFAETLYPEYRKKIKNSYVPPADCSTRAPGYCCGWIERQGRPGGAPNLTCKDGGFEGLIPSKKN